MVTGMRSSPTISDLASTILLLVIATGCICILVWFGLSQVIGGGA